VTTWASPSPWNCSRVLLGRRDGHAVLPWVDILYPAQAQRRVPSTCNPVHPSICFLHTHTTPGKDRALRQVSESIVGLGKSPSENFNVLSRISAK
jgi:hypothetical protein